VRRVGVPNERGDVLFNETRVDAAGGEIRVAQQVLQEGDVGANTSDVELAEGPIGYGDGVGEVSVRVADDLREERVEVRVGPIADVAGGVDADAPAGRDLERGKRAARGAHGAIQVHRLDVDAGLNREAAGVRNGSLLEPELGEG